MQTLQRKYIKTLVLSLVVFLLAGCGTATQVRPGESGQAAPSITVTALPTLTHTPAPTNTPTPIPATPTSTATFTPTPTIALPLGNGQDIPYEAIQPITVKNADQIIEVARYGQPNEQPAFLSADKKQVLSATTGAITFTNTASKNTIRTLATFNASQLPGIYLKGVEGRFATLSADGLYLLKPGFAKSLELWSVNGEVLYSMAVEDRFSADLSPNTRNIALGKADCTANCQVQIIDWRTGETQQVLDGYIPIYSPDGNLLAVRNKGEIVIYSTQDWQPAARFALYAPEAPTASHQVFSPDSQFIAQVTTTSAAIWRISDQSTVIAVEEIGFSSSQSAAPNAIFSANSAWMLIQPKTNASIESMILLSLETGEIRTTGIIKQLNTVYWPMDDGSVDQHQIPTFMAYSWGRWDGVTFLHNDREITLFGLGKWEKPDYAKQRMVSTYLGDIYCTKGECTRIPYPENVVRTYRTKDGTYFSLLENGANVDLYREGEQISSFPKKPYYGFSGAGDQLIALTFYEANNTSTEYWIDSISGETLQTWKQGIEAPYFDKNWISFVQFTMEGGRVWSDKNRVIVFDNSTKSIIFDEKHNPYFVLSNQQKGELILINANTFVHKFIDESGLPEETVQFEMSGADEAASGQVITSVDFSPDKMMIVLGMGRGRIILYDAGSRRVITTWQGHADTITATSFSPDGMTLATYGIDGSVRVWGVRK